jgi:hypothetical protein
MTIETCKICTGVMIDLRCSTCGARKLTIQGEGTKFYNRSLVEMVRGIKQRIPGDVTEVVFNNRPARLGKIGKRLHQLAKEQS